MELSPESLKLLCLIGQMEDDGRYFFERESDGMLGFSDQTTEEVVLLCHRSKSVDDIVSAYEEFKEEYPANGQSK